MAEKDISERGNETPVQEAVQTQSGRLSDPERWAGGADARSTGPPSFQASTCSFHDRSTGLRQLVTYVFAEGDDYLDSDVVSGVKDSLFRAFAKKPAGIAPDGIERAAPYCHLHYDFALAPQR